jgi:hypothetical protein
MCLAKLLAVLLLGLGPAQAAAQDMMRHVDLVSPRMSGAEMTREQVIERLKGAAPGQPADLKDRSLNGLDLPASTSATPTCAGPASTEPI